MERKLGISANCLRGIGVLDALDLIKEAGFNSIFSGSGSAEEISAIKAKADALGIAYDSIHAPFERINEMWMPGLGYLEVFNGMKQSIDRAAENGVPVVVIHVSSGWNAPQVNDLGLARYDEIILYAKEKGVTIALENLRMLGNLACMIDRYDKLDNVKFCYDCGHEHCYTKTVRWMDIFTTNVCCTHIHDNPGRPAEDRTSDFDWHMLPFDGSCDYGLMMKELNKYGYDGPLSLEVSQNRPEYQAMSHEEFLATCYERLKKISEM